MIVCRFMYAFYLIWLTSFNYIGKVLLLPEKKAPTRMTWL